MEGRTQWVNFIARNIKKIIKESTYDDAYDREKWRFWQAIAVKLKKKRKNNGKYKASIF